MYPKLYICTLYPIYYTRYPRYLIPYTLYLIPYTLYLAFAAGHVPWGPAEVATDGSLREARTFGLLRG